MTRFMPELDYNNINTPRLSLRNRTHFHHLLASLFASLATRFNLGQLKINIVVLFIVGLYFKNQIVKLTFEKKITLKLYP